MKGKTKNRFITSGYVALIFVVLAVGVSILGARTFGWLNPEETALTDVTASDFKVMGQAYFGDTSVSNLREIKISTTNSDRYLGNLKYVISYEGISPAYLRVRILEQWVDKKTDTIQDAPFTQYKINADNWYDNRVNDYCYYYKVPIGPSIVTAAAIIASPSAILPLEAVRQELVLFEGVDMDNVQASDANTELTLIIQVEAVQPNRFREFWKIDHLPWETLVP